MSLFKHNCETDGHKFEARYDENPADLNDFSMKGSFSIGDTRSLMYYKSYVHDICTKCGKIINK